MCRLPLCGEHRSTTDHARGHREHQRCQLTQSEILDHIGRGSGRYRRFREHRGRNQNAAAEHDQRQRDQSLLADFLPDYGANHGLVLMHRFALRLNRVDFPHERNETSGSIPGTGH